MDLKKDNWIEKTFDEFPWGEMKKGGTDWLSRLYAAYTKDIVEFEGDRHFFRSILVECEQLYIKYDTLLLSDEAICSELHRGPSKEGLPSDALFITQVFSDRAIELAMQKGYVTQLVYFQWHNERVKSVDILRKLLLDTTHYTDSRLSALERREYILQKQIRRLFVIILLGILFITGIFIFV